MDELIAMADENDATSEMYYHQEMIDSLSHVLHILKSIDFQKSGMSIEDYLQTLYKQHQDKYLELLNNHG